MGSEDEPEWDRKRERKTWVNGEEGTTTQRKTLPDGGGDPCLCIFDYLRRLEPSNLPPRPACLPMDWWSIDYLLLLSVFKHVLCLSITPNLTMATKAPDGNTTAKKFVHVSVWWGVMQSDSHMISLLMCIMWILQCSWEGTERFDIWLNLYRPFYFPFWVFFAVLNSDLLELQWT